MTERTVRAMIRGRVQGVGFRHWTATTAHDLSLSGFVRNRRDGTVEAVFRGPADAVQRMIAACRQGPPAARVDGIDAVEASPDLAGENGFSEAPTV